MRGQRRPTAKRSEAEHQVADPAGASPTAVPMNRVNRSIAKPMSFSRPMMTMANPQATRIGSSGPGVENESVPDVGRRDGEQLLVVGEVRREEDAQEDLGELDRLELRGCRHAPTAARPLMLARRSGDQRRESRNTAEQQEQVAVAVEVPRAADEQQRQHVGRHADAATQAACGWARARVPAGDHRRSRAR